MVMWPKETVQKWWYRHVRNMVGSILVALVDLRPGSHSASKVELDEDLGMEAIRKIEVENFPAFIITDDKVISLEDSAA